MKIPKQIKFLGHIVKVKIVKELSDPKYNRALYDYDRLVIEIDKLLSQDLKESCFFHEIAEMLSYHLSMSYHETMTHDGFSRYIDLLWAILKDNNLLKK